MASSRLDPAPDAPPWQRGVGIAVLVPCFNEEAAIGKVIDDFREQLPEARIVVYDNDSTDRTSEIASERGAEVRYERRRGKGEVINAMLRQEEADFFVMVDGDDTYDASGVLDLLEPVVEGRAHMAVGARRAADERAAYRPFHVFGNRLVRTLVNAIFGANLTDIMSGYRAFSRRTAGALPVVAFGFDTETEMTVQMLANRFIIEEVPTLYRERGEGSHSKLKTVPDGVRVLLRIFSLSFSIKPLASCGLIAIACCAGAAVSLALTLSTAGQSQVLFAILAATLTVLTTVAGFVGVLLHVLNYRIKELIDVLYKMRR